MKYYIAKESIVDHVFSNKQTFFASEIEGLDEAVVEKLLEFEQNKNAVRRYVAGLVGMMANPHDDINKLEVPACLQGEAPKESPPKKKATAPRSNSKSQQRRKKIQSASSTSRKKAKSSG